MKKYLLLLGTMIVFAGCANLNANDMKTDTNHAQSNMTDAIINKGLPVKKLTISSKNGRHEFQVEVASNERNRQIGLMNRLQMDEDKGMLFSFDTQGYLYFWMKNTLFPLDILFIDQDGEIQHIAHNVQPCKAANDNDCPKTPSEKPVRYAVEINGGMAARLQIEQGDQVSWN